MALLMRNTEHPAYHPTEFKLRVAMSNFCNFQQLLRDDGYDYDGGLKWLCDQACRITEARDAAGTDPAKLQACAEDEARVEAELFERLVHLNKFIHVHAPDPRWPWRYELYLLQWEQCRGEPVRPLAPEDSLPSATAEARAETVTPSAIYGVPCEKIEELRANLSKIKKYPPEFSAIALFFCGLFYAADYRAREGRLPAHDFADELARMAETALEEAVDFANAPEAQVFLKKAPPGIMPDACWLLLPALLHGMGQVPPLVFEWLFTANRGQYARNYSTLIFAMGVRALSLTYARHLITQALPYREFYIGSLPEECAEILRGFLNSDEEQA